MLCSVEIDEDRRPSEDFPRLIEQGAPSEICLTLFIVPAGSEQQDVGQRPLCEIDDDLGRLASVSKRDLMTDMSDDKYQAVQSWDTLNLQVKASIFAIDSRLIDLVIPLICSTIITIRRLCPILCREGGGIRCLAWH